jgi:hypothetical protein
MGLINIMEGRQSLEEYLKNSAYQRKSLISEANQHLSRILLEEEKKTKFVRNKENPNTLRNKMTLSPLHNRNSKSFTQSNFHAA